MIRIARKDGLCGVVMKDGLARIMHEVGESCVFGRRDCAEAVGVGVMLLVWVSTHQTEIGQSVHRGAGRCSKGGVRRAGQ
jgi:hypothetical protein